MADILTTPQRWRTPKAAAFVGYSPSTLKMLARRGKVGFYRTPGGHMMFDPAELARLVQQSYTPAKEVAA